MRIVAPMMIMDTLANAVPSTTPATPAMFRRR